MRYQVLQTIEELRTYAVVFDEGDDSYELVTRFARDEQLTGSHRRQRGLTAGSHSGVTSGTRQACDSAMPPR